MVPRQMRAAEVRGRVKRSADEEPGALGMYPGPAVLPYPEGD